MVLAHLDARRRPPLRAALQEGHALLLPRPHPALEHRRARAGRPLGRRRVGRQQGLPLRERAGPRAQGGQLRPRPRVDPRHARAPRLGLGVPPPDQLADVGGLRVLRVQRDLHSVCWRADSGVQLCSPGQRLAPLRRAPRGGRHCVDVPRRVQVRLGAPRAGEPLPAGARGLVLQGRRRREPQRVCEEHQDVGRRTERRGDDGARRMGRAGAREGVHAAGDVQRTLLAHLLLLDVFKRPRRVPLRARAAELAVLLDCLRWALL
mmetsp:Transcript_43727/g.103942  ORF Transcript_43727/g.103942 Transcript_43727/m.103942 type:complete len:263 (-) Transcript_43727:3441-4229(-)